MGSRGLAGSIDGGPISAPDTVSRPRPSLHTVAVVQQAAGEAGDVAVGVGHLFQLALFVIDEASAAGQTSGGMVRRCQVISLSVHTVVMQTVQLTRLF